MADDTDRPTAPAPPSLDPHERPTLSPCLACGGHCLTERRDDDAPSPASPVKKPSGTFSFVTCRWCTHGLMDPDQAKRWAARHKSEPPTG